MAGRGRQPAAASFQLPPVTALLFLWVFSWGHVEASIDVANMTALQKHVAFFDRNMDGIITASEIFEGYVAIGCDIAFARATASSISAGVGPKTSPVDAPLPHLSIYIEYIHKAMHGSDTGAYDAKGRFVPEKFEEIFTKHAKIRPDALTSTEIEEMILANRDPFDPQSCYLSRDTHANASYLCSHPTISEIAGGDDNGQSMAVAGGFFPAVCATRMDCLL
ncbi:probable peroxygenase 4 isoform X1 [Phragmites australis]|uniref:probable peroxygenase 4 isoform X1 n=1 Tax=Phragmites australis TaxID=29695 RepID=UPI002D785C6A|nr:probable peroxygenase 4 isoform X1 [Phragmites australis]